jgi:hypothetical protein
MSAFLVGFDVVFMYLFDGCFNLVNFLGYVAEQLCMINVVKYSSKHVSPLIDCDVGNECVDNILR